MRKASNLRSPRALCGSSEGASKMMKSNANGEAVNTKVRGAAALKFTGPGLTDESAVNAALGESATNTSLHMTEQMDSKLHVDDTEYNLLGSRTDKGDDITSAVAKESTLKMRRKRQNIVEANCVENGEIETAKSAKKKLLQEASAELEDENMDGSLDVDNDMQKMLAAFGVDMGKTMSARRKKLEQYTTGCLKTSARKLEETWQLQQEQRMKLQNEFNARAMAIFSQWETDIEKTKENEEKLQNQLKQQQKLFQQLRLVQTQRMVAMKDLCESFCKNTNDLEKTHLSQQTTSQAEMKRELTLLQKQLLMDAQRQEMDSVRKSLQTLFY